MAQSLKKELTEELFRALESGSFSFKPFHLEASPVTVPGHAGIDGVMVVRWGDRAQRFGFQCKRVWSRRSLEQLRHAVENYEEELRPLLVAPFLSDNKLDELEDAGVSGLDLNGNGLLLAMPEMYARRTGAKNQYKSSSPTTMVYRSWKVAALVPRVFVDIPRFATVQSILDACHARMSKRSTGDLPLKLSTVSKALAQLEEDLVIVRTGREARLVDPERLLDGLARAYRPPVATGRFIGRTKLSADAVWAALRAAGDLRLVRTGRDSAPRYTELVGAERTQLYVSDLQQALATLEATPTTAFPNLELIETAEEGVYFDAASDARTIWASMLQTYLEISAGGAREVEAARALRTRLLQQMRTTKE